MIPNHSRRLVKERITPLGVLLFFRTNSLGRMAYLSAMRQGAEAPVLSQPRLQALPRGIAQPVSGFLVCQITIRAESCCSSYPMTHPSKIANTFKSVKQASISRTIFEIHRGYPETSFLFERAQRFDIKGRKHVGSEAKLYAGDLDLRKAHMNFDQHEETHVWENVIYNALRGRSCDVDAGIVPSYPNPWP